MRRFLALSVFLTVAIVAYATPPQPPQDTSAAKKSSKKGSAQVCGNHGEFTSSCNPYGSASVPHAVDKTCGNTGDATSAGDQAQDKQKNNLCASGTPKEVKVADLKTLQGEVDQSKVDYGGKGGGHAGPPADRATLFTKIPAGSAKEGDLVSFVGYIVEAKPGSSETVNCHCDKTTPLSIDVHMALADHALKLPADTAAKDAALCTNTFVAETTPHLRPKSLELTSIQTVVGKKIVRVTGPLLFDGSHRPCKGSTPGSGDPSRLTVWEIHPVYKIEVCSKNSPDQCQASDWQPLGSATTGGATGKKGGKKGGKKTG